MSDAATITDHFVHALEHARIEPTPYRHWLLSHALPPDTAATLRDLPIPPPRIGDTKGKRETNNATRSYFAGEALAHWPACREVATAFQDEHLIDAIERTCGVRLGDGLLRIEYCQDMDGFWLEPHTDIGAKLFTLLIYLSEGPETASWGTDIYDPQLNWIGRAPFAFNAGLIFVPGNDTWHGFAPRPIRGVRRSIIVNYVKNEWRAREQLAFPDRPVRA